MPVKKANKKNKKANSSQRLNPPFDHRILDIGRHLGGKQTRLQRGWLVHADNLNTIRGKAGAPAGGNIRGRIHFLYNPSEVTASHNLDLTQANGAKPVTGTNALPTLNVGDVGLSLLFDRTYELWDRSKKHSLPGRLGVYSDVWAFYQFFGMTTQGADVFDIGGLGTVEVRKTWASLYPTRPLQATPLYAYIGDKLKYYGLASGLSVTYSHWTHQMIPARCRVDLSIGLATDPNGIPKSERRATKQPKKGGNRVGQKPRPSTGRTHPGIPK